MINAGMAWHGTSEILATWTPLTDAEKVVLWNELHLDPLGRGYDLDDVMGCYNKLHFAFDVPNTDPQTVDRDWVEDPRGIEVALSKEVNAQDIPYSIVIDFASEGNDLQAKVLARLIKKVFTWQRLDVSQVRSQIPVAVLAGFMPQSVADEILYMPAPNWRPTKQANPRVQTLFGDPSQNVYPIIHPMEIEEVINGNR